jgi:hypothetical protein
MPVHSATSDRSVNVAAVRASRTRTQPSAQAAVSGMAKPGEAGSSASARSASTVTTTMSGRFASGDGGQGSCGPLVAHRAIAAVVVASAPVQF